LRVLATRSLVTLVVAGSGHSLTCDACCCRFWPLTHLWPFLLQVLANVAIQLLVLDLCMSFAFTTIVIAALLDAKDDQDLSINSSEASWLGKTTGCRAKPHSQSYITTEGDTQRDSNNSRNLTTRRSCTK